MKKASRSSSRDPVEAFRRQTGGASSRKKEPLALREKIIFFTLSLVFIFIGWSMGGMRAWSVITLFILSVIPFCFLFIPLGAKNRLRESPVGPLEHFKQLLKFPIFWLGLPFFSLRCCPSI